MNSKTSDLHNHACVYIARWEFHFLKYIPLEFNASYIEASPFVLDLSSYHRAMHLCHNKLVFDNRVSP